jgi:hypothetical protein
MIHTEITPAEQAHRLARRTLRCPRPARGTTIRTDQSFPADETLDEAMRQAYSEYTISNWRFCPDDVDPLEYIQAQCNP